MARWIRRLLYGLFVVLVTSEAVLRWLWTPPSRVWDRPAFVVVEDPRRPSRDRLDSPEKSRGVVRILVLGDSYTWGANVQSPQTYPKLLEWLLNTATDGKRYEVLNGAVSGASTEDELSQLRTAWDVRPDLVVFGYFINDPDTGPVPPEILQLQKRLMATPVWVQNLRRYSRLVYWADYRRWTRRFRRAQEHYIRSLYDPRGRPWQRHRQVVAQVGQECRSHGVPCLFVIWPHLGFPLNPDYPFQDIHRQVHRLLQAEGLPWLDLLSVFWGMDTDRLQAVPALDPHPSEIAHRVAAEALFRHLQTTWPVVREAVRTDRLVPNAPVPSVRLRMAPLETFSE
jgi:lysophospholipase L1-like esterase